MMYIELCQWGRGPLLCSVSNFAKQQSVATDPENGVVLSVQEAPGDRQALLMALDDASLGLLRHRFAPIGFVRW